jgi:hypothetical protein
MRMRNRFHSALFESVLIANMMSRWIFKNILMAPHMDLMTIMITRFTTSKLPLMIRYFVGFILLMCLVPKLFCTEPGFDQSPSEDERLAEAQLRQNGRR